MRTHPRFPLACALLLSTLVAGALAASRPTPAWAADLSVRGLPPTPGFEAVAPARVLDTRSGTPLAARATGAIQVTGRGGVPASGVLAPVMNLTVTQPKAAGNLTAFPNGTAEPTASNLNFVANQTIPNLAITKIGVSGRVAAKNNSPATLHLIADVFGYVRS